MYSWQAVEELNLRPKNWKDLLTEEPFTRQDIITLQDPQNVRQLRMDELHYVRNNLQLPQKEGAVNMSVSADLARTLNHLERPGEAASGGGGGAAAQRERLMAELALAKARAAPNNSNASQQVASREKETATVTASQQGERQTATSAARAGTVGAGFGAPMRSTGAMAAAFTSSAMTPTTRNLAAMPSETNDVRPASRKAYVSMHTSLGDLNLELHADLVPKTCQNFLLLAARGYFANVCFHRSIKHFMIQGGDPTGTGKGGVSAYGKPFSDEYHATLRHDGRGVVSMANSGPNTNMSQFFILYKSAAHLDGKHSVFGRVVGGIETTLASMEKVSTDSDDRPKTPIVIEGVTIFDNPFDDDQASAQAAPAAAKDHEDDKQPAARWFSNPGAAFAAAPRDTHAAGDSATAVGRLVPPSLLSRGALAPTQEAAVKRAKTSGSGYGNFDAW